MDHRTEGYHGEIHWLRQLARLAYVVRFQKTAVMIAVGASCLLGVFYYATTQRQYQSNASLLVLQTGADTWTTGMSGEKTSRTLLETYRNMFRSAVVLEGAVALLQPSAHVDFGEAPRKEWPNILRSRLQVETVANTNILEIAYRSKDPRVAAEVVDAMLTAYTKFMDRLHRSTAGDILEILTNEKARLEKELDSKEQELLSLRRSAGELVIGDASSGGNVVVKRAVSLNDTLIVAQEKRLQAQALLTALTAAARAGEDLHPYAAALGESVGREVLLQHLGLSASDAQAGAQIQHELIENQAKLEAASRVYGSAHREVIEIQERIRLAERFLRNWRQSDLAQLRQVSREELAPLLLRFASQQAREANEHEQALRAAYAKEMQAAMELDGAAAQLDILQHDIGRLRGFYDVVLQRIKDIDLGRENEFVRTSVLSRPQIRPTPVWPRGGLVAFIAIGLGLAAGVGFAAAADLLDDHFRSLEEMQHQAGLPVLGVAPKMAQSSLGPNRALGPNQMGPTSAGLPVVAHPQAVGAEAFRTLRTALVLAEGGVERFVISSCEASDGKTTIVANLAASFAQSGKRTLLVDADMRRPGLSTLFNLRSAQGLSTLLRSADRLDLCIPENLCQNVFGPFLENLDVLPSGPRPVDPTELLASERFRDFLTWSSGRYDYVLIDSPPSIISDAAVIARLVDGVLFVVRPSKNRRRTILRAVKNFAFLGVKVLGLVVNRVDSKDAGNRYGYGYEYHYVPENEMGEQTEPSEQTNDVTLTPEENISLPSADMERRSRAA